MNKVESVKPEGDEHVETLEAVGGPFPLLSSSDGYLFFPSPHFLNSTPLLSSSPLILCPLLSLSPPRRLSSSLLLHSSTLPRLFFCHMTVTAKTIFPMSEDGRKSLKRNDASCHITVLVSFKKKAGIESQEQHCRTQTSHDP